MKKGFTLVELIVVIAILAILSVTSFVVFSAWFIKARNSRRITDIKNMEGALTSYYYSKKIVNASWYQYPIPWKAVSIVDSGDNLIGLIWVFDENVTSQMKDVLKAPLDPFDKSYYWYALYRFPQAFELVALLEYTPEIGLANQAYALELGNRVALVVDNIADADKIPVRPLDIVDRNTGFVTSDLLGTDGKIVLDTDNVDIKHITGRYVWWVEVAKGLFKIAPVDRLEWSKADEVNKNDLIPVGKLIDF